MNEKEDKPPSIQQSHNWRCAIRTTHRRNKPDDDIWRAGLLCYTLHNRGLAHSLLPSLNDGRHNTFLLAH